MTMFLAMLRDIDSPSMLAGVGFFGKHADPRRLYVDAFPKSWWKLWGKWEKAGGKALLRTRRASLGAEEVGCMSIYLRGARWFPCCELREDPDRIGGWEMRNVACRLIAKSTAVSNHFLISFIDSISASWGFWHGQNSFFWNLRINSFCGVNECQSR